MSDSHSIAETKDAAPSIVAALDPPGVILPDNPLHAALAATLEKMADAWRSGNGIAAEQCLEEHPELKADPEAAVRVVYEELCLREERGERVGSAEFYDRFPQWRDALEVVLECHHLLREDDKPVDFPKAGQTLGELQLISELGRGGLGCVFLATQPSLSDRPLAVKITPRRGQEHLSLARLQHTNIVPLYLVQDFPNEHLRAMCMPYLGGTSWATILKALKKTPLEKRSGRQIVQQLAEAQGRGNSSIATTSPAVGFLNRSSYVDAVCWIGACLADALAYAHQRGLAHLDIKPSNVLLASDGQPMLLDFHLACEIAHLRENTIERLGGTPGYMSPEQIAATNALRNGDEIKGPLDGRSDIYSLGVLLYESLIGKLPEGSLHSVRKNLRSANRQISRGLEDIVCLCLSSSPAARYQDASLLAADLRCHLASLPLRTAANHSLLERLQKWRRRKPYAMPVAGLTLVAALVIAGVGGFAYRDRIHTADANLEQSQHELAKHDYANSVQHAQSALGSIRFFPWKSELQRRLKSQIALAQHAQAVAGLHELVEQLQFLDGETANPQKLAEIATGCRSVWAARNSLVGQGGDESNDESTNQPIDDQLRHDLLDLAILSARLEVQLAPPDQLADARRQAMEKLDQARELCGADEIVALEQRDYRTDAKTSAESANSTNENRAAILPTTHSAWESYAIGRWLLHHGAAEEAEQQFSAALELAPNDFWAYFQQMRANFELSHFEQALVSATVCVALAPQQAECFFNRGLCHAALHHGEQARADFETALSLGGRRSQIYYQLARLNLDENNLPAARENIRKSLADDPSNAAALALEKELPGQ